MCKNKKKKINELIKLLKFNKYKNNISIEMTRPKKNTYQTIQKTITYIKNLF